MAKKVHFLVNPNSGGGDVGRNWEEISKRIQKKIGKFEFTFTGSKGHASTLAQEKIREKTDILVIIGGDGTVSEVVDGVIKSKNNSVSLVVLNLGTGGDFSKTLGVAGDLEIALEKIQNGKIQKVDVGKVSYKKEINLPLEIRYFINITGCGMAGAVVRTVNKSSKRFGGFSYYLGGLANLITYQNKAIRYKLDDSEWVSTKITTLAVCNGQYFGGGMRISPKSELNDGYFDVVLLQDWNLFQKAYYSKNLYNGTILSSAQVESYRCKKIEIEPIDPQDYVYIDSDGEDIGIIPMKVEVLPSAVQFLI
ncbi:diacylglycerol/lipid kinase family protein [Leptospira sp. GIMC2001]|uniref:diacylglycerol/lipid kinase family protein n=1 Tax=Leptospira sp. GIMC2001 TaxID=1513297 RepID=UPI00234BCB09|nr:diacylglycerol kinase family protein [Leptospira sp. GIMC2001]WCL49417.1 diacylglycerol kinase family lipid kinase [Leptospira sp. GIMC2001]